MVTLAYSKNSNYHEMTKHIDIKYHYIINMVMQKEVVLKHMFTNCMVVDPITKSIARDASTACVRNLGLCRLRI